MAQPLFWIDATQVRVFRIFLFFQAQPVPLLTLEENDPHRIAGALAEKGIMPSDISAWGYLSGPGSYTGLRIALAMLKAWAYVFDTPVLSLNKMLWWAAWAQKQRKMAQYVVFLKARAGEVFMAVYNIHLQTILAPTTRSYADLMLYLQNSDSVGVADKREWENHTEFLPLPASVLYVPHPEDALFWEMLWVQLLRCPRLKGKEIFSLTPDYCKEVYITKRN